MKISAPASNRRTRARAIGSKVAGAAEMDHASGTTPARRVLTRCGTRWKAERRIATIYVMKALLVAPLVLVACRAAPVQGGPVAAGDAALRPIGHIVVIYLENRSFDNLYGEFAGADGLAAAAGAPPQVDASGTAFATLPAVPGMSVIPTNLANGPFSIEQYVPANVATRDLVHRFYQEQVQIEGGRLG